MGDSDLINFTTSDGFPFAVRQYQGRYFPPFMPLPFERIPQIKEIEGKDDDVILLSYPKTGTNWVSDMVYMLKNQSTEAKFSLATSMLELQPDVSKVTGQPSPRMFATHLTADFLSESVLKKAKVILVCRNPKDAAVSFFHHSKREKRVQFDGTWPGYIDLWVEGKVPFGSYFDYYLSWEGAIKSNEYDFQLVYYEDFHIDCVGTLRKLCKFLGYDRTDEFLEKVRENCQMSTIQKAKEEQPDVQALIKQMSRDNSLVFYRKGVIGDWKNHFTVAQNEAFDKVVDEKMDNSMYKFTYEMPE